MVKRKFNKFPSELVMFEQEKMPPSCGVVPSGHTRDGLRAVDGAVGAYGSLAVSRFPAPEVQHFTSGFALCGVSSSFIVVS